jgi:hypothetical protein
VVHVAVREQVVEAVRLIRTSEQGLRTPVALGEGLGIADAAAQRRDGVGR